MFQIFGTTKNLTLYIITVNHPPTSAEFQGHKNVAMGRGSRPQRGQRAPPTKKRAVKAASRSVKAAAERPLWDFTKVATEFIEHSSEAGVGVVVGDGWVLMDWYDFFWEDPGWYVFFF